MNLKPWPERPAAKTTFGVGRVAVDDEVLVGRHRVEANGVVGHRGGRRPADGVAEIESAVVVRRASMERSTIERIVDDAAARVFGDFHASFVELGEAVEHAVRQLEQEHGQAVGDVVFGRVCFEPEQRLAADGAAARSGRRAARPAHAPAVMIKAVGREFAGAVRTRTSCSLGGPCRALRCR